jgi:hypothetical protein
MEYVSLDLAKEKRPHEMLRREQERKPYRPKLDTRVHPQPA